MNVEHHVGGCIVLSLNFFELFITEKLEGHREDVGYSLDKKLVDVIYVIFVGLTVEESVQPYVFSVDFDSEVEIVLKYSVPGVQHLFEFLPVFHLLFGSMVGDREIIPICFHVSIDFRGRLGL